MRHRFIRPILSRCGAVAILLVTTAVGPVLADDAVFVMKYKDYDVYVEPVGRQADLVVLRETYRAKGQKPILNGYYAYDCSKKVLRYVDPSDGRVMKDAEFYDGAYRKAHDHSCAKYRDKSG